MVFNSIKPNLKISWEQFFLFIKDIIKLFFILSCFVLTSAHSHAESIQIGLKNSTGLTEQNNQEQRKTKDYAVHQAASEIKIDGILNENAWKDAVLIKLPYEWLPGDNIPAPVDTDCLVTYDHHYFYVAVRCYDPDPSKIRAHLMDRDSMEMFIQDDHISLMIDTFNDERRGFQFRVNPLGVQADANFSESEGYEDFSWDTIWASAGKITDWGWAAEIAIPFNQLRFPKTSETQTWGFSIERSYPRSVRHRMTSHPTERDRSCIICQFNKIIGIKEISPGLNIELDPTLTAIRTDRKENFPAVADSLMENGSVKADPGITARWGITPNLMFNAAVNPDFSQIEADVRELEVNTRFAIRYPEKRPFFLEGADIFLTPIEAVFTRTVADPMGGIKLSGKIGKNAFGIFGTYDRINNLLFPSNQGSSATSLDQEVASGVFRFRRDVGKTSHIGVLYTGRASDDYSNHVAGFDGFFRLSQTKNIHFQYLHSETNYSEQISNIFSQNKSPLSGDAFTAGFESIGRNWIYFLGYEDFNPNFRADYGYVPRVDMRGGSGFLGYRFWGKDGDWFTNISLSVQGNAIYNHGGALTDREVSIQTQYQGPLQTTVIMQYENTRRLHLSDYYDLDQAVLVAEIKPAGGVRLNITALYGDCIDYSNARQAMEMNWLPFVEFSLGPHINLNFQHAFQRLSFHQNEIFTANLSQAKIVYNFSVRTFVRAIVQYLDVARNPDLYVFPVSKKNQTVFTQFLFSYKLNPQTVAFLGYSDNYLGMTSLDITQTDRTFFLKIGYAWIH